MTKSMMDHGANAVIVGRKQNKLDESCKWLLKQTNNGTKVIGASADVRKPEELKAAVKKVRTHSHLCSWEARVCRSLPNPFVV